MKQHLRRLSPQVGLALLVVAGLVAALAGLYMLTGLAVTLIAGGAMAAAIGLLVDVDG